MTVTLRWHSAKPVQQAVARLRFGPEAATSPEAAKVLATTEHHVLGIYGMPATIARMQPDELKTAITLKTKGDGVISPASVQMDRPAAPSAGGQPGPRVGVTVFAFFPRGDTTKPTISVEDKEIEVVVKAGRTDFKRKFKLDKMVFDGKLEI
jgi:hypothetical protein